MTKEQIVNEVEKEILTKLFGGATTDYFNIQVGPLTFNYASKLNKVLVPIEKRLISIIDDNGDLMLPMLNSKVNIRDIKDYLLKEIENETRRSSTNL